MMSSNGRKESRPNLDTVRFYFCAGNIFWKVKCKLCQKEMQGWSIDLVNIMLFLKDHSLETIQLSEENSPNYLSGGAPIAFVDILRNDFLQKERLPCN